MHVDAEPLVVARTRRHARAPPELAATALEDRLDLDDLVLHAPRDTHDLVHAAYAAVVDAQITRERTLRKDPEQ